MAGEPTQSFWHPMRKTAHRGIRHYGDGLTRLEETLAVMASEFVAKVTSYDGQPIDLRDDIHNFVMKVRHKTHTYRALKGMHTGSMILTFSLFSIYI